MEYNETVLYMLYDPDNAMELFSWCTLFSLYEEQDQNYAVNHGIIFG